ncbi:MAG: HNH endonuclease [Duodenibacillus sp.]|nr:HNH endonuclease [Duodenibacillus sp.]
MSLFKAICTTVRAGAFVTRVGFSVAGTVAVGAVRTVETAAGLASDLARQDWDGAEKRIERKLCGMARGLETAARDTLELTGSAIEAVAGDRDFFTQDNVKRASTVAVVALGCGAAGSLLGSDADGLDALDGGGIAALDPGDVDNGVYTGDALSLERAGEIEGTQHIAADEVVRSAAARNAFLEAHGLDAVPEGYELHHIVPLSEGGADAPENMVLVDEATHDEVTAAHARYYGWHG